MPKLDGTGPEGNGPKTGRGLGKSSTVNEEEKLQKLGKGIGKKRKTGGGTGHGNRLKSGLKDT
ncbi:DUF5320 domain-containing protein [uncultured Sunxiuqinia sp.]|uniref:DUF5320 domain-containing protein n=1 Tax=uncultured Sunxiuqinia sp. TaxID=1573825 RepID=UPI002AA695B2|nr:DUF5320 domain-containing protein [uncultured Sunxiuqinia sp.]